MGNSTSICAVPVCDRTRTKREWCEGHYTRWRKFGTPGTEPLRPQREHHYQRAVCDVEGCGRAEHVQRLCKTHYVRLRKTGDPGGPILRKQVRAVDNPDGTRTCASCGGVKPIEDYYPDRACKRGKRGSCKTCDRAVFNARRDAAPDIYRALYRRGNLARRALLAGVAFDPSVTTEALRARDGDACHYCGVTMVFGRHAPGAMPPTKASLEHVIPISRGGPHTFQNVVLACLACLACNFSKNARTPDEWRVEAS